MYCFYVSFQKVYSSGNTSLLKRTVLYLSFFVKGLSNFSFQCWLHRETEDPIKFSDIAHKYITVIDEELTKLEALFTNIDIINNKMKTLIQAVLGDDTATTERYAEALADAQHIQVIIDNTPVEEEESSEEDNDA
jgi:hypothetical protein